MATLPLRGKHIRPLSQLTNTKELEAYPVSTENVYNYTTHQGQAYSVYSERLESKFNQPHVICSQTVPTFFIFKTENNYTIPSSDRLKIQDFDRKRTKLQFQMFLCSLLHQLQIPDLDQRL